MPKKGDLVRFKETCKEHIKFGGRIFEVLNAWGDGLVSLKLDGGSIEGPSTDLELVFTR